MKGFGARERNGLIVFACITVVLLGIGPVADRLGCTRRKDAGVHRPVAESIAADSVRDVTAGDAPADGIDSIGQDRKKRKPVSKGRKRKESSSGRRKDSPAPPARRNYLDDRL